MKKLSKIHLKDAQLLTDAEMKHITGGEIYGYCNTGGGNIELNAT